MALNIRTARAPLGDQILVILAGLVMGCVSLGVILYSTGGHIAAPLDDTYIHLQYAQQLADGHFFAYNTEDGYSSGATSFLYVLVLGGIARLGARGDGLVWAAELLNVGLFAAAAWLSYRLGWLVRNRLVAGLAALLFLLDAHLVWGFATGMETGLVCTLVLLCLWGLGVRGWGFGVGKDTQEARPRWAGPLLFVSMVALAWARPEGLALVWLALAVIVWRLFATRNNPQPLIPNPKALLIVLGSAALVGLLPLLLNWALSGTPTPNAALAKSELYQHPQFQLLDFLRDWIGIFSSYFTGVYATAGSTATFIPFALLFVMLGGLPAAWREIGRRRPGLFTVAMVWFLGGMLVSALLEPTLRARYQMPYYSVFTFLTAVGLYDVARVLLVHRGDTETRRTNKNNKESTIAAADASAVIPPDSDNPERISASPRLRGEPAVSRRLRAAVIGAASLGMIVLGGNVITLWTALGENVMDIYNQQVYLGHWIADTLPPNARVALNDVGAMKFYGQHYVYDLVGLTTNATAGMRSQGDGVLYTWLRALPPDRRPDYFIIYRDWFPDLSALPGFLTSVYTTALPHPTIVGSTVIVATPNWAILAGQDTPLRPPADPGEQPAASVPLSGSGGGANGTVYLGHLPVTETVPLRLTASLPAGVALPTFDLVADESQYTTHLAPGPTGPVYTATLAPGSYRLYASPPPAGAPVGEVAVTGAPLLVPVGSDPPRQEVDSLDVGAPADEKAHGYSIQSAQWNVYTPSIVREAAPPGGGPPVSDNGRAITGGETFTIATQPGGDLRIVDRHLAAVPQRVRVTVNDQDVGTWFWPAAPGWDETAFLVPAAAITGPATHLRLTLLSDGALTPWQVFHYWFYQ